MPDELAWETTATGVDYVCPGFDVRRDEVVLPDGTATDYHYVDEPTAVVVLPLAADDTVVTIEEWRQAVGRISHGLPAGSVEPSDADLEAAARRELAEETGYEAGTVERLTAVEPANGIANSVHHYFLATGCEPTVDPDLDHNESIRVSPTPYDDLLAAVERGDVRDGRTVTCLLYYERVRR